MSEYTHMYDFAFEVKSKDEEGADVTGAMLRKALQERLDRLSDEDMLEACGLVDTYE